MNSACPMGAPRTVRPCSVGGRRVADPNVGAQRGEVGWELARSIPNSGLARVQLYAGVVEQLFG